MARINLLPWREELRKQQQQDFLYAVVMAVLVTLGILYGVHLYLQGLKDYQDQRNKILQDEIVLLDKKIVEIKNIENEKNKLLTKIDVIQQLQKSRPEIVHLFTEVAKTTPEGIYLTKFAQSGKALTFVGKAQSNARVSAYMRSIEMSPWLQKPRLGVIKSKNKTTTRQSSDFTLFAQQGVVKPKENGKGGRQ